MGRSNSRLQGGGSEQVVTPFDAMGALGVGPAGRAGDGQTRAAEGRSSPPGTANTPVESPTESGILEAPSGTRSRSLRGLLIPSDDASNAGSHEDDEPSEECCAVHGEHLGIFKWNWHHWTVFWARSIAYNSWFEGFIVLCIVLSGALVGVQLYPVAKEPDVAYVLGIMDTCVVIIFTVEVLIKLIAEGASVIEFFRSPSNNLDFFIVVISFVPFEDTGDAVGTATLIRTIRLLRLLKLVKTVPQLRVLVMGVAESVSAIGYIFALLLLLIFIYGVAGNSWFADNDPFNFGTLDQSMVTVFRAVTLEDISDLLYRAVVGCDQYPMPARQELCVNPQPQPVLGSVFMLSITVLGNLVLLNLTVAVVVMAHGRATEQIRAEQAMEAEERRAKVRELVAQRELARARRARSKHDRSPVTALAQQPSGGGPAGSVSRLHRAGLAVAGLARWASGKSPTATPTGSGTTSSIRSKASIAALVPATPKLGGTLASIARSESGRQSSGTPSQPQSPRSPRRPALESMMRARGALMATRAYLPGSRSEGRDGGGGGLASIALAAGAQGRAVASVAMAEGRDAGPGPASGDPGSTGNESTPSTGASGFVVEPSGAPGGPGSPSAATRLLRAAALARQQADVDSGAIDRPSPGDAAPPLLLRGAESDAKAPSPPAEPAGAKHVAWGADVHAGGATPEAGSGAEAAPAGAESEPATLASAGRERSRTTTMDALARAQRGLDTKLAEAEASRRLARIAGLVADAAEMLEQLAPLQADLDASTLILHAVVDGQLRPSGVRGWVMAAGEACPAASRRVARCCGWGRLEEAAQEVAPASARRRRSVVFLDDDLDLEEGGCGGCCDLRQRAADVLDWFPCAETRVRRLDGLTDSYWSSTRGAVSAIAAMAAARSATHSNPVSPGEAAANAAASPGGTPVGASVAAAPGGQGASAARYGVPGASASRVAPSDAVELAEGGSVRQSPTPGGRGGSRTGLPPQHIAAGAVGSAGAPVPPENAAPAPAAQGGGKMAWASAGALPAASTAVSERPTIVVGGSWPAVGAAAAAASKPAGNAVPRLATGGAWGRLRLPAAGGRSPEPRPGTKPTVDRRAMAVIRVLQAVSALEGDRSTVMDLAAKNAAKLQLARERGETVKSPSHAAALQSSLHAAIEQEKMQQLKGVLGARKPFASFVRSQPARPDPPAPQTQGAGAVAASIREFEQSLGRPAGRRSTAPGSEGLPGEEVAGSASALSASEPTHGSSGGMSAPSSAEALDNGAAVTVLSPPGAAAARPMAFAGGLGSASPGDGAAAVGFGTANGAAAGPLPLAGSGILSADSPVNGGLLTGGLGGDGPSDGGGFFFSPDHATAPASEQSLAGRDAPSGLAASAPPGAEADSKPLPAAGAAAGRGGLDRPASRGGPPGDGPGVGGLGGSFRRPKSQRAMAAAEQLEAQVAQAARAMARSRRFLSGTGTAASMHLSDAASGSDAAGSGASVPSSGSPRRRGVATVGSKRRVGVSERRSRRRLASGPQGKSMMSRRALILPGGGAKAEGHGAPPASARPTPSQRTLRVAGAATLRSPSVDSGVEFDAAIGARHVGSDGHSTDEDEDEVGAIPDFARAGKARTGGASEDGASDSESLSLDVEATRFRRINTAAKVLAAVGPRAAAAQRRARARVVGKGAKTSAGAEASAVADTLQEVARIVAQDEAHVAMRATQHFQYKIASAAGATVALAAARKGIASFRRAQERARSEPGSRRRLTQDSADAAATGVELANVSAVRQAEEEWYSEDESDAEDEAKSLLVEAWPEEHRARVLRGVRVVATMLLSHKNRQGRKWRQRWRRLAAEGEQQLALADQGLLPPESQRGSARLGAKVRAAVEDVEAELATSKRRLL